MQAGRRWLPASALALLALGNLALWTGPVGSTTQRTFDWRRYEAGARAVFGERELAVGRLGGDPVLHDNNLYMQSDPGGEGLFSVYVAYYPQRFFSDEAPHDPLLCYPIAGWDLIGRPQAVELPAVDGLPATAQLLHVVQGGRVRRVLHWRRARGTGEGDLWTRWRRGRPDFAWQRVEWFVESADAPERPEWMAQVQAIDRAVADSFR